MVVTAWSQTRVWNGGNGSWSDATKWTPIGVPVSSDILEFNGSSATISNVPGISLKGIIIIGGNIVLNGPGSDAKTLSVGYSNSNTAITIDTGASLAIGNNLTIALANNSRAAIDGTLIVTSSCNYHTDASGTTKTIVNGTIRNSGKIVAAVSMLEFKNGSKYEHARDQGTIPTAIWDKNATCSIEGVITKAPGGLDQVFGNYVWECELQTGGASLGNSIPSDITGNLVVNKTGTQSDPGVYLLLPDKVKIDGSFILNAGTCAVKAANAAIELAGDLIMNGGNLKTNTSNEIGSININFKGNSTQVVSKTGGIIKNTKFTLFSNAVLDLGESVLDGDADFVVEAGGKLMTSHPGGLALTGKTGAIQVTGQRKFSIEADYAYTGTKPQVTGTGLPATVRRLIIDNKSGIVPGTGVTLSKATTVSQLLLLNNGFLQTSSNNMLTIAEGADANDNDNSFIAGPMRKTGNTPFTFPTGWAGGGRIPIGISFSGATATIQAEYKRASATDKGTTINAPLHHISYCEYWELFPVSGNASAVITMYANAYSSCNPVSYIDDFSSVRVARSNGAAWTQIGNTYDSVDAGNGYVISDNAAIAINSNERYFALGHITTAKDPLPVLFDSVLAYEKNEGVNVEWSNLTERDIAMYYVERSVNGIDFTLIGQYLPKSNRDDKARYTSFDVSPVAGTNFYRIKVIQKDTKIIFSKVMRIERGIAGQKLSLYPNPVISNQITLGLIGLREDKYNIRIVNAAGQHIYESTIIYKGNFMTQTLRLPCSLKPGMYGLIVAGSDYRENKTFIVQ